MEKASARRLKFRVEVSFFIFHISYFNIVGYFLGVSYKGLALTGSDVNVTVVLKEETNIYNTHENDKHENVCKIKVNQDLS